MLGCQDGLIRGASKGEVWRRASEVKLELILPARPGMDGAGVKRKEAAAYC